MKYFGMKKQIEKQWRRTALAVSLSAALLLGGCGAADSAVTGRDSLAPVTAASGSGAVGQVTLLDISDMFSNRDREIGYDEMESVRITLTGDSAQADSENVRIDGNVVTIVSEGCYILSGSLQGQVIIQAKDTDKLHLVLDGAEISCQSSAALYVSQADKVFVTTTAGSENMFETVGEYVVIDERNIDGAVFSREDITFNGEGTLKVVSVVGNGIVSKDDLVITGGNYEISAGKHGLEGKDSVRIENGDIVINAAVDGIHSGNDEDETVGYTYIAGGNITLAVQDDGIHSDTQLVIAGGNINVVESYEGLEGMSIEIVGGEIAVRSSDDGLNAAGGNDGSGAKGGFGDDPFAVNGNNSIIISGGKITVDADGDGLDSNGALFVYGGEVIVYGPENGGNGALDYNGEAMISGGTVIALGASQMAQNFGAASEQCSILVNIQGMQSAGTTVELKDADGKTLLSCVAEKSYNSAVLSCPEIQVGQTYTAVMGGETTEVEMTETIYGSGMGFGGGRGGGGFGGGKGGKRDFEGEGGERPDFEGERGEKPNLGDREGFEGKGGHRDFNGEMPELPSGEMPNGTPPELPSGEMPNGEVPQMPNGI
ncbi:MAG: carbohydrate-binding domain-containing protein [Butyrivibrio sp.]|nr:carbohydrate-binding domain-containing protein [Muribaculum sp.]MCM1552783.1 carbohydrate-binding domain-containing protein [Butyrivibrio sp.]